MNDYARFQRLKSLLKQQEVSQKPQPVYKINPKTGEIQREWHIGERGVKLCNKVTLPYFPFKQYLYGMYGITNYKTINTKVRERYWLEYRAWSASLGLYAEASERFNYKREKW